MKYDINSWTCAHAYFGEFICRHSLLATKLLSKVRERFSLELNVKDLFIYSTISSMAKLIDTKTRQNGRESPDMISVPTLDLLKEVEMHDQEILE